MYKLEYSEPFNVDIDSARNYIRNILKAPIASRNLTKLTIKMLNQLEIMPFSRALVDDDDLSSKGVRSMLVKDYLIIYKINENKMIVNLIRFLHATSDWMNILKEDIDEDS